MKKVIAIAPGFHHGVQIDEGQRFSVGDNETGKWFIPEKDYKPKKKKTVAEMSTLSEAARRKSQSFTELMTKGAEEGEETSDSQSVI